MSTNVKILQKSWEKCRQMIAESETELKGIDINELVSSFFCPGPFYYYIFDFQSFSFPYFHPTVEKILGLDPTTITPPDLITRIHSDDMEHMSKCEEAAFNFMFNKVPPDKRKKYKISYCIRIKDKNENYKLFLTQIFTLTSDDNGALGKSFCVHTDISHLTKKNNFRISFLGLDGEPSYCNLDPSKIIKEYSATKLIYSEREMSIIKLIAEGLTADEIGEELFIASTTVRTHIRNLFEKSGCSNKTQLVVKCIKEGLL